MTPKISAEPVLVKIEPSGEKRKKVSIYMRPSVYKSVQHEAIDRGMTVGEVLEEAMHARVMMFSK